MVRWPSQIQPVSSAVPVWPVLLLAALLLSLGVALRIARPRGAWGRRLRSRFFLGVPWGTLIVSAGVVAVYLFLQGGLEHPDDPLVVPFRSWGYTYPLGMLTAAFSHAGLGHLTSNLVGTLTFAPLAEYAVSHFPTERGSQSFGSLRENPFARILAFVAGIVLVSLLTSLFAVGPVVGFSGVVFTIAGFALVYYPITTVVALAAGDVLSLLYRAVQSPVSVAEVSPQVVTPWWADIAIQGHVTGLLYGVILGGFVATHRGHRPSPVRLWLATVAFAVAQSLWAVYWFRGAGRYVLFRAGGMVLVMLLAALITAGVTAPDRTLVGRIDLRSREAAVGLLLSVTIALSVVAVPTNLIAVSEDPLDGVEVRDYTVTYAEDVPDQYVSAIDVEVLGETTQVNTSGVIVVSERRHAFQTVVPKSELAFKGESTVVVGGLGWRETVRVNRSTWQPVGNDSVYRVVLQPPDGESHLAFTSDPALAEPRISGRRVRIVPAEERFVLQVRRGDETVATTPVPDRDENATAGGLTFDRTGNRLYAMADETRVRIARAGGGSRN